MLVLKRRRGSPLPRRCRWHMRVPSSGASSCSSGGRQPIGEVRDLEVDGAEGSLPARLYVPTERVGAAPAPTMLFIHGGGWMYGDLESHDPTCRFLAELSGVQVLAIDYRLAPEHKFPAAVEDCRAAYRWLVDHADVVNADPARMAAGGDSAGGTLALSTAVWSAERNLRLRSSC